MKFSSRLLLRYRSVWRVLRDTIAGVFADGFTHAGNLAYLSLLTLFPFFIVVATVAGSLGRTQDGLRAVNAFLRTLPHDVAALVATPIADVIDVRATSGLLTFGIIVTLWTISGFIETIRAIIRNAYKTTDVAPLWRYRIGAVAGISGAVLLMLAALAAQVLLTGAETFVERLMPFADSFFAIIGLGRLLPALALFFALYAVFYLLTPRRFRLAGFPVWPGPLITAIVWVGTTKIMPWALGLFGSYALTYGSLAGVIIALLFFYIIGLGLVIGANFNAALAKALQSRLRTAAIETE